MSQSDGDFWSMSWHSPPSPPSGTPHGAAGVCLTPQGHVVLISQDGRTWDFPGGRPEGTENWEHTLRREVCEEACATIHQARLLGFARAVCQLGANRGQTIVRSFWRAEVDLMPWAPQFETTHRRLVWPEHTLAHTPVEFEPIYRRVLSAAGLAG